jgi:Tfp pilus assembly protein PilX
MIKFVLQRLQLKMILVVMLALLIPTALIGLYSISITTAEVLRTAEERNLEVVKSQSAAALRLLAEGERDVLFLSQSPAMRRYVGTLAGTADASTQVLLSSQIRSFLKDTPNYMSLRILDISGQEVFGVDHRDGNVVNTARVQLENQANQSYFIETLRLAGQVYVSDMNSVPAPAIETPYADYPRALPAPKAACRAIAPGRRPIFPRPRLRRRTASSHYRR